MEDLTLAATKESVDELSLQMLQNEGIESKLAAILKATKEQTAGNGKHASSLRKETQKQTAELRKELTKQNAELQAAMVKQQAAMVKQNAELRKELAKQNAELRKDILKQNADNAVLMLKQTAALIAAVQEQTKAIEKLAAPARESGKRKRVEGPAAGDGNERETSATDSQTSAAEKLVSSSLNGKGPADAGEGTSTAGGSKKMKAPAPAPVKEVVSVNAISPTEGTCTWTIPNFSKLKVDWLGDGKYSDIFSIGGHKWELRLYPRRYFSWEDESLSLFLQLADDTDKLPKDGKVTAAFSLSVICQHDPEKSHKRESNHEFNHKGDNWHFHNFIPLTDFHDAAKGFLVNDTVNFEAKIEVKKPAKEVVSVNTTSPTEGTCTWTIPNFSKLKVDPWGDGKFSDTFSIGGHKWKLEVYPRGWRSEKDKSVSLFLWLADNTDKLPKDGKVTVNLSLSVICQHDPEKSRKREYNREFKHKGHYWGWPNFIPLTDLHDAANGFLVNDTVIFQAKIEVKKPAKTR